MYQQLAEEMEPLAAAGVRTVWFPPPSESADVAGYLPSRWYNITNRTLLDAAIQAAHDNGIVPMVSLLELQQLRKSTGATILHFCTFCTRG